MNMIRVRTRVALETPNVLVVTTVLLVERRQYCILYIDYNLRKGLKFPTLGT